MIKRLRNGEKTGQIKDLRQTAVITPENELPHAHESATDLVLLSHEECLQDKKKQSRNFFHVEEESNRYEARRLWQKYKNSVIKVNPPYPPMSENEIDASFDLPYTRLPHPKYKGKNIPAYEMIKFSVNLHRGCFGGCAFCTISGPSRQIHSLPLETIDSERGKTNYGNAQIQRIYQRFRRTFGQYVQDAKFTVRKYVVNANVRLVYIPKSAKIYIPITLRC